QGRSGQPESLPRLQRSAAVAGGQPVDESPDVAVRMDAVGDGPEGVPRLDDVDGAMAPAGGRPGSGEGATPEDAQHSAGGEDDQNSEHTDRGPPAPVQGAAPTVGGRRYERQVARAPSALVVRGTGIGDGGHVVSLHRSYPVRC